MLKLKKFFKNKIICRLAESKGFSLVEMLIVILIIAIIAGIVSSVYVISINSQKNILNKANSEKEMRTALYTITKDIREASSVSAANNNYFKFKSDINNDSAREDIEYILSGSDGTYVLNKKINGGDNIFVLGYITDNNIFSYFTSGSGPELQVPLNSGDLSSFKLIRLSFTVNREPEYSARSVNLTTVISLRNR